MLIGRLLSRAVDTAASVAVDKGAAAIGIGAVAIALAVSTEVFGSKTGRKRAVSRAIQEASHYLGNTPAVCRKSYVDPRVIDRYEAGVTISGVLESLGDVGAFGEPSLQGVVEEAVLDLLEETSSPMVEKVS